MSLINIFDRDWYVSEYPDVAKSGIDPYKHYRTIGLMLKRKPCEHPYKRAKAVESGSNKPHTVSIDLNKNVDVVIPVYNALEDVKKCLSSLLKNKDGLEVNVIVVNDASNEETTQWLREFTGQKADIRLIEHAENAGYTVSVNDGLRATTADYVVTLNSDTIVTSGWLTGMIECMQSSPKIGVVGPLSNAASWQNVPNLKDENGFAVNELPEGRQPDEVAHAIRKSSLRLFPHTPFVNGFCFMIKREVIETIGYMDEENFPVGYGEENDFCIRTAKADFKLAIADNAYVFHAKSKSFGHEKRKMLSAQGSEKLKQKHTPELMKSLSHDVKNIAGMDEVRECAKQAILGLVNKDVRGLNVLFILTAKGGGGGAHSIVQEVIALRRLGVKASLAIRKQDLNKYIENYREIEELEAYLLPFSTEDELKGAAIYFDILVATIFTTARTVKAITDAYSHVKAGYYIQDYEPLFYEQGTDLYNEAKASYDLLSEALLFAKTDWLVSKVKEEHGLDVIKVLPSIDHSVYYPEASKQLNNDNKYTISAMIRPQTPRRGAERTMRLLSKIKQSLGDDAAITVFGCTDAAIIEHNLENDFEYKNYGIITRKEVAKLLSSADIFIDLSDYQAFGRTGLESMACGCVPVLPSEGGVYEYGVDNQNSLIVDVNDVELCHQRLVTLITNSDDMFEMKMAALETASNFSTHRAAISELKAFTSALK